MISGLLSLAGAAILVVIDQLIKHWATAALLPVGSMDVLPGDIRLAACEVEMVQLERREYRLRAALRPLLAFQQRSVRDAAAQGARIACGSDAGAYRVLHAQGGLDEQALLRRTLGPTADQILTQGNTEIQKRF